MDVVEHMSSQYADFDMEEPEHVLADIDLQNSLLVYIIG
jgi:hypothetical protein